MVNFYKVLLVVEALDEKQLNMLITKLISKDVWIKETKEMTGDEVFQLFEQTKEDMERKVMTFL